MSIYSNAATYGGSSTHRHSQSHRNQGSGHIYGASPPLQGGRGSYPPPGADPTLWGFFTQVDADGSGSISVDELQKALVNGEHGYNSGYWPLTQRLQETGQVSHFSLLTWVVLALCTAFVQWCFNLYHWLSLPSASGSIHRSIIGSGTILRCRRLN